MTIEAMKLELTKQLLKIEDQQLLEEIQWLLDRPDKLNNRLNSSVELGIQQAQNGEGEDHQKVRESLQEVL